MPALAMKRPGPPLRRCAALVASLAMGIAAAAGPDPVAALELRNKTYFTKPPWSVDLISYYTTVWEPWAEYYFTIELAPDAGASLGALGITQTRGVDHWFPFNLGATRAFLGRPRQAGAPVPVTATFDQDSRTFSISFPEPVPPGSTLTLMLKPWSNPSMADTYMFAVTAYPAGPNPSPTPLGYGTLRIYMPDRF